MNKTIEHTKLSKKEVIQRLLLYVIILIGCFHICRIWLHSDWNIWCDILASFLWSVNVFTIKSFSRWFFNINKS
jgi:hypothetical protein